VKREKNKFHHRPVKFAEKNCFAAKYFVSSESRPKKTNHFTFRNFNSKKSLAQSWLKRIIIYFVTDKKGPFFF